jgi:AcrR family transcriptional regulator
MGHRHHRDDILAGAVETASTDGLSQLTFGRVAKRLGVSDRIVVYYFRDKETLITEVLSHLAGQLQRALEPALAQPATNQLDLARAAWPVLARPESDPVFALFFEASGLAAAGRTPYRTVVPYLMTAWVDWAGQRVVGEPYRRQVVAEAAIAVIDGLLLIRQVSGADVANRAARELGIADPDSFR